MRYSIAISLPDRTATVTHFNDSKRFVRQNTYDLTGPSARRIFRLCRWLTPLKISKANGFYVFARLGA